MNNKIEEDKKVDVSSKTENKPKWAKFRSEMLDSFPSPYRG